jgi:hypothetical protein
LNFTRHCEERSDAAIQRELEGRAGLLRFARNDGLAGVFYFDANVVAVPVGAFSAVTTLASRL